MSRDNHYNHDALQADAYKIRFITASNYIRIRIPSVCGQVNQLSMNVSRFIKAYTINSESIQKKNIKLAEI